MELISATEWKSKFSSEGVLVDVRTPAEPFPIQARPDPLARTGRAAGDGHAVGAGGQASLRRGPLPLLHQERGEDQQDDVLSQREQQVVLGEEKENYACSLLQTVT